MAIQKITSPIARTVQGRHVAKVGDIAYQVGTSGTDEIMTKSLQAKLDEIDSALSEQLTEESLSQIQSDLSSIAALLKKNDSWVQNISNLPYDSTQTLSEKLETLNPTISEVDASKVNIIEQNEAGETARVSLLDRLSNIINQIKTNQDNTTNVKAELDSLKFDVGNVEQNKNATQQFYNQAVEIKSDIDQLKNQISTIVENTNDNIESLQKIAESFNTSFDADAHFEVVSDSTYNQILSQNNINPNCIYFCYD